MNVAVLASGTGTNLQALIDRVHGRDGVTIVAVGSDRPDAQALDRARAADIPERAFELSDFPGRRERDLAMADWLRSLGVELVVAAGYMRLLDPGFLDAFPQRVINVHPALLPAFPGLHVVQQALDYGVKVFGVTVHFLDSGVDTGPIILQRALHLPDADDVDQVLTALHPVEHELLVEAVTLISHGAVGFDPANPRRVVISIGRVGLMATAEEVDPVELAAEAAPGPKIRRALLSVSDKTGIVEFARGLADLGVEIISTGGTAGQLSSAGVPVRSITDLTGFPEIMDGRVKTLHPKLYAGLLAVRDNPEHVQAAEEHSVEFVDLVCVNLYPFERTVAQPGVADGDVIENIDIGGPTMIRAAAKNFVYAAPVVSPESYDAVLAELRETSGHLSRSTRQSLAAAAFAYTARYDTAIARWFQEKHEDFPSLFVRAFEQVLELLLRREPTPAGRLLRAGRRAVARPLPGLPARWQADLVQQPA